jgi:type IV pilus modification protein PilV
VRLAPEFPGAFLAASREVKQHRTAGFSLVEVMCAILILGIGLVGLTQGITAALQSSKESELQTTAALIAAGQIEILRADGFVTDGETEGDGEEDLAMYHWKQSITATKIDGLHDVQVVVENSKSRKSIYELRTLLFDPPVAPLPNGTSDRKDKPNKGGRSRQ